MAECLIIKGTIYKTDYHLAHTAAFRTDASKTLAVAANSGESGLA